MVRRGWKDFNWPKTTLIDSRAVLALANHKKNEGLAEDVNSQ